MNPFFLRAGLLLLSAAAPAFAAKPPVVLPGLQRDGSILLPNQWSLRPVGRQLEVGDFPVNLALHPKGQYVAVLHCGYSRHEIRILDVKTNQPVSQVTLDEAFYGLAWSPDGTQLYCSGASAEVVHAFAFSQGYLSDHREIRLRPENEMGVPIGVATSSDGRALYVAEGWGQRVTKIEPTSGAELWARHLGVPETQARTDPEAERLLPPDIPDPSFPYACLPDERHGRVYVSLWARATVLVLDAKTGAELARWPVGQHPNELTLSADGRLFVAEANFNTVSVIDANSGRMLETLSGAFEPDAPPGSMPNSVALSPDGKTLFVANANNNAVAVFDVSERGRATSLGFIPVGWFPTSVRVTADGRTLIVANGKGLSSRPNPGGPFPGDRRPRSLQEYIGDLFKGTISFIELPTAAQRRARMAEWSRMALANTPIASPLHPRRERPAHNPVPARLGEPSPIQHVIYVVKENRTYDHILGDMPEGNGDPRLCIFPEKVTPNHHALAREFVLIDNFFVDGEVSADGHEWSLGAYGNDFVEKTWPLNYGHNRRRKYEYPAEGTYEWVTPARGYLWDQAAKAGVTYWSFGEFVRNARGGLSVAALPVLRGHIDPQFRGFNLSYPDVKRAERYISELKRFEREGAMPRLQVVRLGNDHTAGTRTGSPTPSAMVADNDLALGQVVEAVSRSRFWPTTAIFVLEDDAQNGADHVDAHRSPAFVISPYSRRLGVDSTMYSTTSMLRTIELILGLQPMSQFDAAAAPMYGCFAPAADTAPYSARPAQIDLNARNTAASWGARESMRMNLAEADKADDIRLNEIVWRSVKGADSPMPAPVRAAFFQAHPKVDDDD